jgi:hypothetical protein
MGNTEAATSPGASQEADEASLDGLMLDALAVLVPSIPVPEAARRRALAAAEALLASELGEDLPPASARRKTPSHPCTVPPESA